jgi:hypothetical protein
LTTELDKNLTDAIQRLATPEDHPNALLNGFVLIAEWVDESGERWLTRGLPPTQPDWVNTGYLLAGLDWDEEE